MTTKINLINQSFEILTPINNDVLKLIELAGRTCYKSEDRITDDSACKFVSKIIENGHHSVIEHANVTVKLITNRGVLAELTRHRLCSFSVESTRFVNYNRKGLRFIIPVWGDLKEGEYTRVKFYNMRAHEGDIIKITNYTHNEASFYFNEHYKDQRLEKTWLDAMFDCAEKYTQLCELGWRPEQAREVLPNSLATEIVITANLREWRHILTLRTSKRAHPQIRSLMCDLLEEFKKKVSVIFDDIK